MDLTYLINILLRRKWLILAVVLLAASATWYFVGLMPDVYKSKSVISTGIIDYKGLSLQKDNPFIQQFQIESSFSGLIEKMRSRSSIKVLSDQLLAHDLLADGVSNTPFRVPDMEDLDLTEGELEQLSLKLKTNNTDSMLEPEDRVPPSNIKLAEAFGYDYESLTKKLSIGRIGETDYIFIEFESESPKLSYFVVTTFIDEFFNMHEEDLSKEENQALRFNEQQLRKRRAELDSITRAINEYKAANGLVDVTVQREGVIGQIKDLEKELGEKRQMIPTLEGQIQSLERQIAEYNRATGNYVSSKAIYNEDYNKLDKEIKELYDRHIEIIAEGKKESGLEKRIEALKKKRAASIQRSIGALTSKEEERIANQVADWFSDRLNKQLDLQYARIAVNSYERELNKLMSRADKLLVNDNYLNALYLERERLETEYSKVRTEYDNNKLYAEGTENPLTVVEPAEMPVEPESKHRALFSIFAGIAGGTFTSILFLFLAFLDSSIQSPSQFYRMTGLPLMGYVNDIRVSKLDPGHLFRHVQSNNELEVFKEHIRKLRTAIETSGARKFLFVSPKPEEGKSFMILLLAYALGLNNKKVLIIDTNFKHNTLSACKSMRSLHISTQGGGEPVSIPEEAKSDPNMQHISIVGNKGGNQSPSEMLANKDFGAILEKYTRSYDFIFMEAAAMNPYSDARELLPFADKLVAVFSADEQIGNDDKDTLSYLRGMNGKMFGGILNKVNLKNV